MREGPSCRSVISGRATSVARSVEGNQAAVGNGAGGGDGSQEEDDEDGEEGDEDEYEEAGGEGRGRWGERLVLVSTLADAVLPLIRPRSDLYRYSAANAHGRDMHEAVDILESAIPATDPAEIYSVTHKALASALKVIARADDSAGIIGDACRRLLELHPRAAAAARTPVAKLVDWMMKFQFDDEVDYFELDPVAYAPALGDVGMASYRKRLTEIEAKLGPRPADRWNSGHSHECFTLDWNAQRLAVLDHDIDAIIRTHAKDRKVAAWLEDTAEALEEIGEIGEIDLAIDWAKQATDFDRGHQSLKAADYWCGLLEALNPPGESGDFLV